MKRPIVFIAVPLYAASRLSESDVIALSQRFSATVLKFGSVPILPSLVNGKLIREQYAEGWQHLNSMYYYFLPLLLNCAAIVLFPGWASSPTETAFHKYALANGIDIFFANEDGSVPLIENLNTRAGHS